MVATELDLAGIPTAVLRVGAGRPVVLLHEQSDFALDFVDVWWCVGHACPAPWAQVHALLSTWLEKFTQSSKDEAVVDRTWNSIQP